MLFHIWLIERMHSVLLSAKNCTVVIQGEKSLFCFQLVYCPQYVYSHSLHEM